MRCNYIAIGAIFVAFKRPRLGSATVRESKQAESSHSNGPYSTISTIMPEHADDKDYYAHGATGTDLPFDYMPGAATSRLHARGSVLVPQPY